MGVCERECCERGEGVGCVNDGDVVGCWSGDRVADFETKSMIVG